MKRSRVKQGDLKMHFIIIVTVIYEWCEDAYCDPFRATLFRGGKLIGCTHDRTCTKQARGFQRLVPNESQYIAVHTFKLFTAVVVSRQQRRNLNSAFISVVLENTVVTTNNLLPWRP